MVFNLRFQFHCTFLIIIIVAVVVGAAVRKGQALSRQNNKKMALKRITKVSKNDLVFI